MYPVGMVTLDKNFHGTVRPYTRHLPTCKIGDDSCRCPKWLYERRKDGERKRYSLGTPSWAEAKEIAAKRLRSFDPEIAAAQAVLTKRDREQRTIADVCQMWLDRTKREYGPGIWAQYQSVTNKLKAWAVRHRIEFIQDVTTEQLERWYSSAEWLKYADTTRAQRWNVVRTMFQYWTDKRVLAENPVVTVKSIKVTGGPVQGRYTAEQLAAIFANIDEVPKTLNRTERGVYLTRLHAFITLLLHTGCDLVDGVLFDKTRLKCELVGDVQVCVYRYHRQKTGVGAVIPLDDNIAKTLLDTPMIEDNPENMPFRFGTDLEDNAGMWRKRIQTVLTKAGVAHVELSRDRSGRRRFKAANVKQFRHTFSITQLVAGQREETVARMLGHKNSDMVRKHYGDWVPERDDAHIREVLEMRSKTS